MRQLKRLYCMGQNPKASKEVSEHLREEMTKATGRFNGFRRLLSDNGPHYDKSSDEFRDLGFGLRRFESWIHAESPERIIATQMSDVSDEVLRATANL